MAGSWEHGNESSGSIKCGEVPDQLSLKTGTKTGPKTVYYI
jgi:hypothetical protein